MPAPRTRPGLSVSRQAEGAPGAFFTPGPQPITGIETPPGTAAHDGRNDAAGRPAPKRRSFSSALCAARCGGGGGGETEHATMIGPGKTRVKRGAKFFFRHTLPRARGHGATLLRPEPAVHPPPARARPPRRRPKCPRGRRRAHPDRLDAAAPVRSPRRHAPGACLAARSGFGSRPFRRRDLCAPRMDRRCAGVPGGLQTAETEPTRGGAPYRRPPQAPREAVRRFRAGEEIGRLSQITAGPPKIRRRERQ